MHCIRDLTKCKIFTDKKYQRKPKPTQTSKMDYYYKTAQTHQYAQTRLKIKIIL